MHGPPLEDLPSVTSPGSLQALGEASLRRLVEPLAQEEAPLPRREESEPGSASGGDTSVTDSDDNDRDNITIESLASSADSGPANARVDDAASGEVIIVGDSKGCVGPEDGSNHAARHWKKFRRPSAARKALCAMGESVVVDLTDD